MSATCRWVDATLFAAGPDSPPTLLGSACESCGTTVFPAQDGCPKCGTAGMRATELPRSGRIWSYTVQYFEPKAPFRHDGPFGPYGVAYVDLGPVIVEGRLLQDDPDRVHVGDPVQLSTVHAFTDDDGTAVLSFAFEQTEVPQ